MEIKDTNSNSKDVKNKIQLNNLSVKQKEVLRMSGIIGGGAGIATGLFTLYSMDSPNKVPGISVDAELNHDQQATVNNDLSNPVEIISDHRITEVKDENVSFGEAFKVAREICGPGGWFVWKGKVFNTFYKEEWQKLNQTDKNDYLASIKINEIGDSESNVPEEVYTVDVNSYSEPSENDIESEEEVTNSDIIQGEIITLDDDSEIESNGYFELPDDIEITVISDEESAMIENMVFDSSELTTFPWESSDENSMIETSISDQVTIPADIDQDLEENVIVNPEEIKEYPWGETMENSVDHAGNTSAEPVISEIIEEQIQSDSFSGIEEFPWGEKNENFIPGSNGEVISSETVIETNEEEIENIGIVLPEEEPEVEVLSQLPPSFNDITEFPWGEPIPHSTVEPNSIDNDIFGNNPDHLDSLTNSNEH